MASAPVAVSASPFSWPKRPGVNSIFSRLFSGEGAIRGVPFILTATVFFCISDAASKYLATDGINAIQIAWVRYLIFVAIVVPIALFQVGFKGLKTHHPVQQVVRGVFMVLSTILFVSGLAYLDVADATAINFVSPVFITALAIPILGEKVGLRRWTAALVGLMGVMIIVQPGSDAFQLAALFPIGAAAVWAGAAIATRIMSATETPQATLVYSSSVGFLVLCALVPFFWTSLTLEQFGVGVITGVASAIAHLMFVLAYRHASATVLAPFSYTQIVWASIIGFLVFGSVPGVWTYVGGAIIAASGLYTAHRERLKSRALRTTKSAH
jgi:drug/metabolite transporter (DMT)-like permease